MVTRHVAVGTLVALLLLPALSGCVIPRRYDDWRLDLVVGVLAPPASGYDGRPLDDVQAAVDLASRQFDASGVGVRYTIVQQPLSGDPAAAVKALADKRADVIVAAAGPDSVRAIAQRAAQLKIPLLLTTPANGTFEASYTTQLALDHATQGRALARLAEREGVRTTLVVAPRDPHAALVADSFAASFDGNATARSLVRPADQGEIEAAGRGACARPIDSVLLLLQPDEAGWFVRALQENCRGKIRMLAAPSARGPELVANAGVDLARHPYADGVVGIEPVGGGSSAFRSLFDAEYSRGPGPGAPEAYDAVSYATLATLAARGAPGQRPIHAEATAAQLQEELRPVMDSPGVKHREMLRASNAVKTGEDIDWVGLAHDFDITGSGRPASGPFSIWRATGTGGIATDPSTTVPST